MPPANVAAIDVGTNSVLLLVAQVESGVIQRILLDEERNPRLGRGLSADHTLHGDSQHRTVEALKELRTTAKALHVDHWRAVGTSALRDASNREAFLELAGREAGIDIRVITGEDEARLVYQGVHADPHAPDGAATIVDVGGGSTEFIWRPSGADIVAISVDVGSNRLLNSTPERDPPTFDGIATFRAIAYQKLLAALSGNAPTGSLILVGGTAKTLAAMAMADESISGDPPVLLPVALIDTRLASLAASTRTQRLMLPGLPAERVDTIVTGAAIVRAVCDILGVSELRVSQYGLRHGVAVSSSNSV